MNQRVIQLRLIQPFYREAASLNYSALCHEVVSQNDYSALGASAAGASALGASAAGAAGAAAGAG